MLQPNRRATAYLLVVASLVSLTSCQRHHSVPGSHGRVQTSSVLYVSLTSLSVTSNAVSQPNASIITGCQDNTGLSFPNLTLSIAANATSFTTSTATFNVGQKAGYLAYGRSMSCNVVIVHPNLSHSVEVPVIDADNASCWFSYGLFAGTDGAAAPSTAWTCSTSGGSYVLSCPSCTSSSSTSGAAATSKSGLRSGEVQTICLVVGLFGCSRRSKWRHTDARDTRHLPEDAAKDVNLRPPKLFVAHFASQKGSAAKDSPQTDLANIKKSLGGRPPVMIVSYGSQSTPNAQRFHHGAYAIAQPDGPNLQGDNALSQRQSSRMQPVPEETVLHRDVQQQQVDLD